MFSIWTNIIAINSPTQIDDTSIAAVYETMEIGESMFIQGYNMSQEIQKTRKGSRTRIIGEQDSVSIFQDERPIWVSSQNEWQQVSNPDSLNAWLSELAMIDGTGIRCNDVGIRRYTVYVRNIEMEITDNTCQWDALGQLNQVFEPTHQYVYMETELSNVVVIHED